MVERYYDRHGSPITLHEWGELHEDPEYKILVQTHLSECWVSTVWLGIDHNFFGSGPPIIFESMVFPLDEAGYVSFSDELDQRRYATEQEAQAGHEALIRKYKKGVK